MVYDFRARDDVPRVARFRLVPADGSPETGRLTPHTQRLMWNKLFQDTDSNIQNNDYLKQEFICRLGKSGVAYRLQVQFREVLPGDSLGTYNPCVVWNSDVHPWIDVATISLTQPLPDDVTDMTTFDIGRVAEGVLGWPEATGLFDFNAASHVKLELCRRRAEMVLSAPPSSENIIDYFVHVVTGGQPDAAIVDNHCRVYISLIGTRGRTRFIELRRRQKANFGRNSKATFYLTDRCIGDLLCAKIYKDR
ncbi:Allene oxide synthase-lipoxygenase protein [Lamellibrachia satsuma]|nr:Allene oxide synthase-lipoxygenase protein [Lamellibrachia satsuma]